MSTDPQNPAPTADLETDSRFPSGRWIGFFVDKRMPGRHQMELILTFKKGSISGEGRDRVGEFILRGRYSTADGQCQWTKRYLARHDVFYRGFNEGKGIWGTWEIPAAADYLAARGGFHIWPEGMADPTGSTLTEQAEPPIAVDEVANREETEFAPAGTPFPG